MVLLIGLIGCLVLCLVVFGGGQIYIPLFDSLWKIMIQAGAEFTGDEIDAIISLANSTPGVVGTKFAFITGYLAASGVWWGYLAMFATYLIYTLPAIGVMIFANKILTKHRSVPILVDILKWFKPIIIGVILAVVVQLFIATTFSFFKFNDFDGYILNTSNSAKNLFFSGWRKTALFIFVPIVAAISTYLYFKNVPLLWVIVAAVICGLVVFEPWLV